MLTQSVSRILLIDIANASEFKNHELVKAQIAHLTAIGPYAEATADEIDAFDTLMDSLEG